MFYVVCSSCILGMGLGILLRVFYKYFSLCRNCSVDFRSWKRSALISLPYFPNVYFFPSNWYYEGFFDFSFEVLEKKFSRLSGKDPLFSSVQVTELVQTSVIFGEIKYSNLKI